MAWITKKKGLCLADLVIVLMVLSVFAVICLPAFQDLFPKFRLSSAVHEISLLMREKKLKAMSEACALGICFDLSDGEWVYRIYRDGNRNGIRRQDMADGIDVPVSEAVSVSEKYPGITFSILPEAGIPDLPPGEGALEPGGDPVRFGSDMVAFSPSGKSSSGSLFLSDGKRFMSAVRLFGPTGRIRRYRFDGAGGCWHMF
jgi:Tfp pilus assembly major pilin PilA